LVSVANGGFLLPEKYILFERFKYTIFLLVILTIVYDKENKKVLKQCQSNGSTNHGNFFLLCESDKEKQSLFTFFSACKSDKEKKNSTFFSL